MNDDSWTTDDFLDNWYRYFGQEVSNRYAKLVILAIWT